MDPADYTKQLLDIEEKLQGETWRQDRCEGNATGNS